MPPTTSLGRPARRERRRQVCLRLSAITFPGFTINDAIGDQYDSSTGPLYGGVAPSLSIGPDAEYQAENTGVFQNRIEPSGTAIWSKGRHSLSFGGSWSYTQLNLRDRRTGTGSVASPDLCRLSR